MKQDLTLVEKSIPKKKIVDYKLPDQTLTLVETEFDRAMRYYKNECSEVQQPLRSRAIEEEHFKQLISLYEPTNRFRIIWELLYFAGMRPIECCWLQRDNFDQQFLRLGYKCAKAIHQRQPDGTVKKIYKSRVVPIPENLAIRLSEYWQETKSISPFGFMFPSFSIPRMKKGLYHIGASTLNMELSCQRVKLGGKWLQRNSYGHHLLSPHSFRRGWITRYMSESKNPFEVARAIGHKSPDTSYQYFQPRSMEKKLQQFVESTQMPEPSVVTMLREEITHIKRVVLEGKND